VAGYGIGNQISQVFFMPTISIATALVTLVGMFFGARRLDLVKKVSVYGIRLNVLISVFLAGVFFIFAKPIASIFTDDTEIVRITIQYIRIIVFSYPLIAIGLNTGRVLQGLGKGIPSLVITSTRVILVAIPLAYVFVFIFNLGLVSVWIALLIAGFISVCIGIVWLIQTIRKLEKRIYLTPEVQIPTAEFTGAEK
jgi:Na+-driven multidrug efflux pump